MAVGAARNTVSNAVHRIVSASRTGRSTLREIVRVVRDIRQSGRPGAVFRIVHFDLCVHHGDISLAGPSLGDS